MRVAWALGLVVGTTVVAVACSDGKAGQPAQAAAPPAPAVPITAASVVRKDMPLEVSVIGSVEAYSTVTVRAQITGELTEVHFQQGDDVTEGQDLFMLDRRPLEAALQQAAATLERDSATTANAKAILARQEELTERGIVAREVRDTARTQVTALEATLASDRAALDNAKVQLQYATIKAPISGRTGALMVTPGNLVRANDQTPLGTINQVTPVYVSFAFPEAMLADLRRYMARGTLQVDARLANDPSGAHAVGHITFVDNVVDQTTGTIKIKGTFPNESRTLWPGQFANVVVRLSTEAASLVVPSAAVQTGPDGSYVYVVKADQTVDMRPVVVARLAGAETIIRQGLSDGERVVTDGHLRLVPGSRVTVREATAPKTAS